MAVMIPDPAHPAHVRSLNVGAKVLTASSTTGKTGIGKQPVRQAEVRAPGPKHGGDGSGLVGDYIGDRRHHGGDFQAVYAVAREEIDWWEAELGRELPDGRFGENLTTVGLDVDGALVGERWQVGEVLLEVTGPRVPCRTFAGAMGERRWVRRFTDHGRSGAYLAVVTGGVLHQGDPIEVVSRPDHGITVPETFRAFMGDLDAARAVIAGRVLNPVDHAELEESVRRRST